MAISIFLVDDHALIRQGIKQILAMENDFVIAGDAADGESALETIENAKVIPDVLLLDMNLPDMTGVELARRLLGRRSKLKIIVLTVNDGAFYVVEMLRLGVRGYILKGSEPELLTEAIRTVAGGGTFIDPALADIMLEMDDLAPEEIDTVKKARLFCLKQQETRLTVREMEVLRCIADGMSNIEMARKLFVSDKTIKNHLTSIYRKLNVEDRTQALIYAYKHGMLGEAEGYICEKEKE